MYHHVCECRFCGRGIPDEEGYGAYCKIERCGRCHRWMAYGSLDAHRCDCVAPGPNCGGERNDYGLIVHRHHKFSDNCPCLCVRCDVPLGTKGVDCMTSRYDLNNAGCGCGVKRAARRVKRVNPQDPGRDGIVQQ